MRRFIYPVRKTLSLGTYTGYAYVGDDAGGGGYPNSKVEAHVSLGYRTLEGTNGAYPIPTGVFIEGLSVSPGTFTTGNRGRHENSYFGWPYLMPSAFSHASSVVPPESATEAVTTVASRTNPSKPTVNIPSEISQLWQLPKDLYNFGKSEIKKNPKLPVVRRKPGNGIVAGNFQYIPIFSDLLHILNFTEEVNQRVKQLKALHSGKGTGGYARLWDDHTASTQHDLTVSSSGVQIDVDRTSNTTGRSWSTCKWVPDVPGIVDDKTLRDQAKFAIHGWSANPSLLAGDIWELMPWSWMIDYFGNVGEYLSANGNSVGASPINGCHMVHIRTTISDFVTHGADLAHPMKAVYETKYRLPAEVGLSAKIPFLGNARLLNLMSIANNYRR